jgi:hypothetical protein
MTHEMTPQEALAALYALYHDYMHITSCHLDYEQWQAERVFLDQAYEALRALVPVVHGHHQESREFATLCGVCRLRYARHCQVVPGHVELFYCEDCLAGLPQPKDADVPCSTFPGVVVSYSS